MSAEPNYRRTKPGKKTYQNNSANGAVGPTSQIPGLCQTADEKEPEQRTTGRRVGIFESDSDYVKLAKGGGHKGLLSHDDVEEGEERQTSYRPADFFNSGDRSPLSPSSSADSTSSHRGRRSPPKGAGQSLAAPFGTDDISPWDQLDSGDKVNVGDVAAQVENMSMGPTKENSKYKKISHDKKSSKDPVSMSKLLSFGYMEDEKKGGDDDASSMTSEQTSTYVDDLE